MFFAFFFLWSPSDNCTFLNLGKGVGVLPNGHGKFRVSSSFSGVWLHRGMSLLPGDELLLAYESGTAAQKGPSFWRSLAAQQEHCVTCFGRAWDNADDPLIQCEGDGGRCLVSRHRMCLPSPPSLAQLAESHYFCPQHLESAKRGVKTRPAVAPGHFGLSLLLTPPGATSAVPQEQLLVGPFRGLGAVPTCPPHGRPRAQERGHHLHVVLSGGAGNEPDIYVLCKICAFRRQPGHHHF